MRNAYGGEKNHEIIPLGANKELLACTYGFIWNRTLEILIECDIFGDGCSMSPNDVHNRLALKANLEEKSIEIEIISSTELRDD